jgi:hypothetical protein
MVVLLKLHFDVSEVTFPDFYPFILDILHASDVSFDKLTHAGKTTT